MTVPFHAGEGLERNAQAVNALGDNKTDIRDVFTAGAYEKRHQGAISAHGAKRRRQAGHRLSASPF
jgi:hypothetical protein